MLNTIAQRFNSVTIGQSQRGGATVNLGISTGSGTLGINYTGATGNFDGSFDVIERQAGTGKLSAELNYGEDGFSVSGNADLGNGLGFGLENGRNGMSGSLTILGSTQGTVDGDGNYEANGNFLGEISGQDIIDLNNTRQAQREAEENERNPVKDAADAKDAPTKESEEDPQGLVDLVFAGTAVLMTAAATFIAGGGSSPTPAGSNAPNAGNGGNVQGQPIRNRGKEGDNDGDNSDASNDSSGEGGRDSIDSQNVNLASNTNATYGSDPYNDGTGTMSDGIVVPSSKTTTNNVNKLGKADRQTDNGENTPSKAAQATRQEIKVGELSVTDKLLNKAEKHLDKIISKDINDSDLRLTFSDGSSMERKANQENVILKHKANGSGVILRSTEDINYLVEKGREKNGSSGINDAKSLKDFLNKNLKALGTNFTYDKNGGNKNATNEFGEGKFGYQTMNQVLSQHETDRQIWKDTNNKNKLSPEAQKYWTVNNKDGSGDVVGMECQGTSLMHVFKSLGLIRPDLNRQQVEEVYTNIHGNNKGKEGVISNEFDNPLRFRKPLVNTDGVLKMAQTLQGSDWAKITGMHDKPLEIKPIDGKFSSQTKEIKNTIDSGYVVKARNQFVVNGTNWGGHGIVIKDITSDNNIMFDDPYGMQIKRSDDPTITDKKQKETLKFKTGNYFDFWYMRVKK
ncbi:MAG TPA: hypothetical protein PLX69_22735, partial [Leptospiraceae bacterium]|nr:hypothetical protein [Leptospiraceae bacterium]